MKIIDSIWFNNSLGTMGIVVGEDEITGKRKAYVGIGRGADQDQDIELIKENGVQLTLSVAEHLVDLLIKGG